MNLQYVKFLDEKGGFFYERWGDAPVHSLAVALFLPKEKVIHLDYISYRHNPYTACPRESPLLHSESRMRIDFFLEVMQGINRSIMTTESVSVK